MTMFSHDPFESQDRPALVEGQIVYFVPLNSGFNARRAAVITSIMERKNGLVNLYIFPDGMFKMDNLTPTSVRYDKSCRGGTWHWLKDADQNLT